ncbi:hypothetical protein [Altererythrobacter sp. MF3-039]|uniref:hypothetical protein n=1 Tax=Altererythrobacter sp. MF3-039 TaxID=3252901 RepID=UPI00390C9C01
MTTEEKREELKERIAAGEKRHEERNQLLEIARETSENVKTFAKQHPVATVTGGVALGLIIGAMTPKGRLLGKRAGIMLATFAEIGATQALAGMAKAGEAARVGQDKLEDLGDDLGAAARAAKREIGYRAGSAADGARTISKRMSRKTGRTVRNLKDRVTH